MCKNIILILISYLAVFPTYAAYVEGKIIDKNEIPLIGVTVKLSAQKDSLFISGASTDIDGKYKFTNIKIEPNFFDNVK